MKGYGNKLRELRGRRSREEIAKAVNVSVSAISMYENEERSPRDEIKLRLANFFGESVQEIFFTQNVTK
ncbi:MAG: helix-turn-helix transcriptional regulator [Lachnospiraceae bacterium]|nr:helix-turn-helix transcriptional regulator [Lachnospiraceae bacterium]